MKITTAICKIVHNTPYRCVMAFLCIAANTIPRWMGSNISGDAFCKWQSISFVLLGLACFDAFKNRTTQIVFDYVTLLAINNAIDEVTGNATKLNEGELGFAIAVTVWTLWRLKKQWQLKSS